MMNGLTIIINGNKLEPWNPPHVFQTKWVVKSKKMLFPITLSVMQKDVPSKYRHIQYEVWGKNVTVKKPEWISDVLEPHKNRVYAIVDANKCSKYLKLNKNSFKSGQVAVADMYKSVERWMHETLRREGYVEKHTGNVKHNTKMTKFFQNLFKKPEYEWLNPNTMSGIGTNSGAGSGKGLGSGNAKTNSNDTHEKPNEKEPNENKDKKRGGSGLNITLIYSNDTSWDGCLDPETNNFICNRKHPLYIKYENNEDARNQRVKSVLFSELIKNGARRRDITAEEAFITHRNLMTEAKDLKVV